MDKFKGDIAARKKMLDRSFDPQHPGGSSVVRLYTVRLLQTVKTDTTVYLQGSWQYAYQDTTGFLCLRGRHTGWDFSISAKPGIDFAWSYAEDPRTNEELVFARDKR